MMKKYVFLSLSVMMMMLIIITNVFVALFFKKKIFLIFSFSSPMCLITTKTEEMKGTISVSHSVNGERIAAASVQAHF
jgi:hypothetical protein